MKMYRVRANSSKIEELEVVDTSPKQLVFVEERKDFSTGEIRRIERREAYHSTWHDWFATKEAAVDFVYKNAVSAVSMAKHKLKMAENDLAQIILIHNLK